MPTAVSKLQMVTSLHEVAGVAATLMNQPIIRMVKNKANNNQSYVELLLDFTIHLIFHDIPGPYRLILEH